MQESRIIIASEAGIAIRSLGDIPDLLGVTVGTDGLILTEQDLSPEFFDLRIGGRGFSEVHQLQNTCGAGNPPGQRLRPTLQRAGLRAQNPPLDSLCFICDRGQSVARSRESLRLAHHS